ncbi:hypothetical protein DXC40_17150 [Anaerotruncus colihominis]|uniref:Uncharacterized protein n=1 Tax=Anaerotruncus colihominis TaxID=169435 RepID=A0A3E3IDY0_9FIRM|nr:hypothetical protein DXC40_17150 [Anaerotruncus colihominis]
MLARGSERRDTPSERNRINGIFKGRTHRLTGRGLLPNHPNASASRTRTADRTVLRANMARSPKEASSGRTMTSPAPLTV